MGKLIDLTGQRFGRLSVIKRAPNKNNCTCWLCLCDCGKEVIVRSDLLRSGGTKSCGCLKMETVIKTGKNNFKDLTGQRFGKLVAISSIYDEKTKRYKWLCQCDCGNNILVLGSSLNSKNTQSCGCMKSRGENIIKNIFNKNNINYISQYHIVINNKDYYYDFAILEENKVVKLVEFDGIQHYGRISGWATEERWKQLQKSDKIKNKYAIENNLPLYRIPYWEIDNLTLSLIFDNKFLIQKEM